MGLFDGIFGQQGAGILGGYGAQPDDQQPPGVANPLAAIAQNIAQNRNGYLGYLAGALKGGSLGESIGNGLSGMIAGGKLDQDQQQQTQTARVLAQRGVAPDIAALAARSPGVLQAAMPSLFSGAPTEHIRDFEYARKQGYPGSFQDFLRGNTSGARGRYSTQPIQGSAPNPGPAGAVPATPSAPANAPGGVVPAAPPQTPNYGVKWLRDTNGNMVPTW